LFNLFARNRGKAGLVGLTASADRLCLAHIEWRNGNPVLDCCEEVPADTEKAQADALAQLVKKYGLEDTRTNFVLSPTDYKLFLVEAPRVETHEMASAVKWKIKDLVDSPLDQLAISVFPVPDDAYRGQEMVYVVAARKSKIGLIVDLVSQSGLKLDVIDIPELAMLNISSTFSDDSNGLAFVDLRSSGSTLNLCRNGEIYLTRHLNTRIDQDIINSGEWGPVRDKLVLEIQRSLDYYESQMGQAAITRVLLTPRETDTGQLVSQLSDAMAVHISGLDLASEFAEGIEMPSALQHSCTMAIGGALRHQAANGNAGENGRAGSGRSGEKVAA
jgi:MSHA biogenesis protein MshI